MKNEVDDLFEFVRKRYGNRLTQEELENVREKVVQIVETAVALRSVRLKNSDEPFFVFSPLRRYEDA